MGGRLSMDPGSGRGQIAQSNWGLVPRPDISTLTLATQEFSDPRQPRGPPGASAS